MGYHRAGFEVVGVDLHPQPRYPFAFYQADALTFPLDGFDAVHGSPCCQRHANVTKWRGSADNHEDLLTPMLARLRSECQVPWVVENVPEALDRWDLTLCGSQFGLNVRRHRGFLAPWLPYSLLPPCQHHSGLLSFAHKGERAYADAMGCEWMTAHGARQAIPPAYTEYIGTQLLAHLQAVAA